MYNFPSKPAYLLVINEHHSLFPEQENMLAEKKLPTESFLVPADGMTLAQIEDWVEKLAHHKLSVPIQVIIASPIPAMIKLLAEYNIRFYVFHNDRREKKELPGGKIIQTVAQTGWQLV